MPSPMSRCRVAAVGDFAVVAVFGIQAPVRSRSISAHSRARVPPSGHWYLVVVASTLRR